MFSQSQHVFSKHIGKFKPLVSRIASSQQLKPVRATAAGRDYATRDSHKANGKVRTGSSQAADKKWGSDAGSQGRSFDDAGGRQGPGSGRRQGSRSFSSSAGSRFRDSDSSQRSSRSGFSRDARDSSGPGGRRTSPAAGGSRSWGRQDSRSMQSRPEAAYKQATAYKPAVLQPPAVSEEAGPTYVPRAPGIKDGNWTKADSVIVKEAQVGSHGALTAPCCS